MKKSAGFALLIAMGTILVFSVLTGAYLTATGSEVRSVDTLGNGMRAFFLSEAGLQLGMRIVYSGEWATFTPAHPPFVGGWYDIALSTGTVSLNPIDADDVTDFDDPGYSDIVSTGSVSGIGATTAGRETVVRVEPMVLVSALIGGSTIDLFSSCSVSAESGSATAITITNASNYTKDVTATLTGQVLEDTTLPTFEEVFGMSEATFRGAATEYDGGDILGAGSFSNGKFWYEGDLTLSDTVEYGLNAEIVVNGAFELSGTAPPAGHFTQAIIWVKGSSATLEEDTIVTESAVIVPSGTIVVNNSASITRTPITGFRVDYWRES